MSLMPTDSTNLKQDLNRKGMEIYCHNKNSDRDIGLYFRRWQPLQKLKLSMTQTQSRKGSDFNIRWCEVAISQGIWLGDR